MLIFAMLLAGFRQFAADSFQIHACLVHVRVRPVLDRLDVLLSAVSFADHPCFDRLNLLP
jgi:hypothetical protein